MVIAENETDEDEDAPVTSRTTNEIDAPTGYVIRSYGMRWRIETCGKNSKQDHTSGDCKMQTDDGVSHHWHLLMAASSLGRLDPESSALRERVARKRHGFE